MSDAKQPRVGVRELVATPARLIGDALLRPQRLDNWVLLRGGVGALVVVWAMTLLPDLGDFYGPASIVPSQGPRPTQFSVFKWWSGDMAVGVVLGLAVLGGLALIVGVGVRLAAPVTYVAVTSLMFSAPLILNGGDDVLRLLLLFVALYALIAPATGLDTPVGELGRGPAPSGPPWGLVVIRIQIAAMYVVTVMDKMEGSTWLGGTATVRALNLDTMRRFWVPDVVVTSALAHNLMTWGTLITEIALPLLLLNRRTRRWGVVLGLCFHASLGYVLRLGLFPATVGVAYLAFLTPEDAAAVVGWIRSSATRMLPSRRRSTQPTEPHPEWPVAHEAAAATSPPAKNDDHVGRDGLPE
ncbi:MAG: HTTM domain-containing protein [Microthrixaceae bacterium]|nr:HTTM domain-containing protein [Microthrixaceae bacterium]